MDAQSRIILFDEDTTALNAGGKPDLSAFFDLLDRGQPAAAEPPARLGDSIFVLTSNYRPEHEHGHALPDALSGSFSDAILKRFMGAPAGFVPSGKIAGSMIDKKLSGMGYSAADRDALGPLITEAVLKHYDQNTGAQELNNKINEVCDDPDFRTAYWPYTQAGKAQAHQVFRAAVVAAFRDGPGDVSAPPRAVFKKKTPARVM